MSLQLVEDIAAPPRFFTRADVRILETRIANLEAQLAVALAHQDTDDVEPISRLQYRFRLTRQEARYLQALYTARHHTLSREDLLDAIYGDDPGDSPEIKIIDVFVSKLRKKIGFGTIETIWGSGYVLTASGTQLVREALGVLDAVAMTPEPDDHAMRVAFMAWFGLERASVRILAALYRGQHPLDCPRLADIGGVALGAVRYHLSQLRQALDAEAIDYTMCGYQLTESGRAECRAALWQMGEELRRES